MDTGSQVSGVRCQALGFRINDTVNSTLVANKFFVFILNHTPSYTVDNSYAMPFGCRSGFNRDLLWQISNKCKFIDIYSLYSSLLTPDSSFLFPLSYFLFPISSFFLVLFSSLFPHSSSFALSSFLYPIFYFLYFLTSHRGVGPTLSPSCRLYEPEAGL